MKLSKRQIGEINDFLQNGKGFYSGHKNLVSRKSSQKNEFYDLETLKENQVRRSRKNLDDNLININSKFIDSLIYGVLSKMPQIERPAKVKNIYHYTNGYIPISKNGLRASNFLNNSNDVQEVTYLLKNIGLKDTQFVNIYNNSIMKRYNSFSYQEIDALASSYYLDPHSSPDKDKIETTVSKIEKKFIKSSSADFLIHGFVRYDIFGKKDALNYLKSVIKKFWPHSTMPRYIVEIISILTTFVKRKCSGKGADDPRFDDYDYSSEKEYRFLYNGINTKGIPYHLIEIDEDWWRKTKRSHITNKCKNNSQC